MKYDTIKEAAQAWVREFNAFPLNMLEKLAQLDIDDWVDVTPIAAGDTVYCYEVQDTGEVERIFEQDEETFAEVRFYNGEENQAFPVSELSREYDSFFPMWGTMWQFDDLCDSDWIEENLQAMADCGFRVYQSYDFGYFFGIDGAGYDFYEAHWIPLYKARGLQWHNSEN